MSYIGQQRAFALSILFTPRSRPFHFVNELCFSFLIHLAARMENTLKKFVVLIPFDRELSLSIPHIHLLCSLVHLQVKIKDV